MLRADCGGCRHLENSPSQAAAASVGRWCGRDLASLDPREMGVPSR